MNRFIKHYIAVLLFTCAFISNATSLPENHSVNGGLTIIPIDIKQQPEAYYQGKRIPVLPSSNPNQWLLVVAIPLNSKQPIHTIDITKPIKTTVPFQVSDKLYTVQSLTIKDLSKVDPQPEDQLRIDLETKKLAKIYAQYSNANPFDQSYSAPIRGPISSLFGLNRVYNQQPRDPHSGLDIAAPEGKPVYAVNKGTVVDTGDYFFTGNTVIVDHGMGVFSLYAHLSDIQATTGQEIQQGEQLGLIGMTGRVTGPHLHWTMIVNQTLVDPLLFVPVRKIAITPPLAPKTQTQSAAKS